MVLAAAPWEVPQHAGRELVLSVISWAASFKLLQCSWALVKQQQ